MNEVPGLCRDERVVTANICHEQPLLETALVSEQSNCLGIATLINNDGGRIHRRFIRSLNTRRLEPEAKSLGLEANGRFVVCRTKRNTATEADARRTLSRKRNRDVGERSFAVRAVE